MFKMVQFRIATGVTRVFCTAVVLLCGKQMEKLTHYYFSWIVSFQKQRYRICEMLPLETKQSGIKKGPCILQGEVEKVIKKMRNRKATGNNYVPVDVLKLLGEGGLKILKKN